MALVDLGVPVTGAEPLRVDGGADMVMLQKENDGKGGKQEERKGVDEKGEATRKIGKSNSHHHR